MATKPTLDGPLARELFIVLGEKTTDVLMALFDMNDAYLEQNHRDFYEASAHASRCSVDLKDALAALARGDYQTVRDKLGVEE